MGATYSSHFKSSWTSKAAKTSNSTAKPTTTFNGPAFPFPVDIVEEIFMHLPYHEVATTCRLVCHHWKQIADSNSFWRERCRREGYHLRDASRIPADWKLFYFLCKTRRNLLQNPRGEDGMNGWKIMENGGNKWLVDPVRVPHPNELVEKNFVTSYVMCMKSQLIDLVMEGYSQSFLDDFQPYIKVSDWYAPRRDCGCQYVIFVHLLNEDKQVVAEFAPDVIYFAQWNDQRWHQMSHVFKNYGPGVRYVHFMHGGKDTQFWAGWYGIRLTESCVEVCPAKDTW